MSSIFFSSVEYDSRFALKSTKIANPSVKNILVSGYLFDSYGKEHIEINPLSISQTAVVSTHSWISNFHLSLLPVN